MKKNLLFISLDNKFIEELIFLYNEDFNIRINIFNKKKIKKNIELLEWADIIFCEWCEINAVWYSKNKKSHQKLFIRLHRYELFTSFFFEINWKNVDNIIFISPKIKELANKFMIQKKIININNFDWEFYLNNNSDLFKNLNSNNYNKNFAIEHWLNIGSKIKWCKPIIEANETIDYSIICNEFTKFNGGKVIYNYVKSNMFNNIPKKEGYEFNLGIMGILPKIKRPDIALDILEYLIKINNKFKLYILSKNYKEWSTTANNELECNYYNIFFNRINDSDILKNNVVFDNYTNNPELWFSKIGYILSVSDIEGSHQSIAEGMATGCIPFIYGNALNNYKLDEIYPKKYCFYDNTIENLCDSIIKFTYNENLRKENEEYCKKFSFDNFNLKKIYQEFRILF